MTRHQFLVIAFFAAAVGFAETPPAAALRPVIFAPQEGTNAMKSAPVILLVEIVSSDLTGDMRMVGKPSETGGPMVPEIPLHLARIQAKVLIAVRGSASQVVEFYSWIWASGSHGGPRLFHPTPGGSRVVFLRQEHGYLHTVGDYPAYDLEIPRALTPSLVDLWNSGQENGDALEGLVAFRIRTDFENRSFDPSSSKDPVSSRIHGFEDLLRLVGPLFVASQLEKACRSATNPDGRIAACSQLAWEFRDRCEAYRLEELLSGQVSKCKEGKPPLTAGTPKGQAAPLLLLWVKPILDHRREVIRVWASALDR